MSEGAPMSRVAKSKRIDRNRYSKTYPFLHRIPSYSFVSDPRISYEVGNVCFNENDTITYTFESPYLVPPNIIITSKGDDINVWIESISETAAVFRSSANTSSCVSFHIVSIGIE